MKTLRVLAVGAFAICSRVSLRRAKIPDVKMKTLANPDDRLEIMRRLRSIKPTSRRRWGEMTPHEMICHLSDAFHSCLGEKEVRPASRWIPRRLFRWAALWVPVPWPRGVRGPREWDPKADGTKPADFESDRKELHKLIERFAKAPVDFRWPEHPFFGRMSPEEWKRLGYLHADHHLRQFGA